MNDPNDIVEAEDAEQIIADYYQLVGRRNAAVTPEEREERKAIANALERRLEDAGQSIGSAT